jgi:hypothetical protein
MIDLPCLLGYNEWADPVTDQDCKLSSQTGLRHAWAINSAGECYLHTVEVAGSNPVLPTIFYQEHNFSAKPQTGTAAHENRSGSYCIHLKLNLQCLALRVPGHRLTLVIP